MLRTASCGSVLAVLAALTVAAPAAAQDQPPPAAPAPAPPPAPKSGKLQLELTGGVLFHGRTYALRGRGVTIVGHVNPYVPGQIVRLRIKAPKRKPALVRAKVRRAGAEGLFRTTFRVRRTVRYTISASHKGNSKQRFFFARASAQAIDVSGAGPGSHGLAVSLLKQGLGTLGYPVGHGPSWTDKLGREIMAFRKTNGMARDFTANAAVFRWVFAGKGAFKLRHPEAGKHVEFDWSRQVLVLADGGKPVATYHASSGKPSTPTVFGTFHFYLKAPGTNQKGMYDSNYFIGNYAVHGYPDVPTYPASHGCIRISNADAPTVFAWIAIGDPIYVYA